MTIQQIIAELQRSNLVEAYANKVGFRYYAGVFDDVKQELWRMICDSGDKLLELYNHGGMKEVRGYAVGIVHRQLCSDNSYIFKRYYRHPNMIRSEGEQTSLEVYGDTMPTFSEEIPLDAIRERLDPFDVYALNTWLEYGSDVDAMAKATGYDKRVVRMLVDTLKTKIKNIL